MVLIGYAGIKASKVEVIAMYRVSIVNCSVENDFM